MKRLLAYLLIVLGLGLTSSVNANNNKPIIIPTHNWTSQIVGAYVIGEIFESIGKKVKYRNADSQAVYESIRIGDVSISHEVWESAFGASFDRALSKGGIIDAGSHPARSMEEIGVPTWVIEKNLCPGLPNWTALRNCPEVFARPGSNGKGIILEGPQSWHGDLIPQRIRALGLDSKYKVRFASSADQLWKELYDAKRFGRGILMFNWSPNFTDAEGFTMIKWPEYFPGCRPQDGGSGACGSPSGYLKKAASTQFAKMHPQAYEVFKNILFTTKDFGKMAYYVDVEKMTHKDAAKKWLSKNKYKWEYWTGRSDIAYNAFKQQAIEQESFFETNTVIVKEQDEISKKQIETAQKKDTPKEFKPKSENLDQNPPVINIASKITVNDTDYEIEGYVKDESDKIYIEAEGRPIEVKNGKFIVRRFSIFDEEISIVAIDQWGNRSKPKLVKILINQNDTYVAEKLEPLNPTILDNKISDDTVALIIGIEKYKNSPDATFANLDAKYFFEYAKKGFGIKQNNIKLLLDENASLIDSISTLEKWLPAKIKNNKTNLIIFFAGHGLASNDGKELYLLPQDSDPDLLSRTALSRSELFTTILKFKPKSVTMFFDTCYSGQSREEKTLLASARPIRVVADEQDGIPNNFTIFSASQLNQISSGLKEANHGIFSYFLMKGLEGNADTNKDKKITNGELLAYMDENVSQKAAELGRQQNPSLSGDPDKVLISYK